MRFVKVGLLFATSTLSRLLAGLFVVKIIAVYAGAEGLGQLGQFMSLMAIITMLAGGGISAGIIKYVAEVRENEKTLVEYIGSASAIGVGASIFLALVLSLAAPWISVWLFGSGEYVSVIIVLAFAQGAIAGVNLLLGLVNGHQRVFAFAVISGLSSLFGAVGVAMGARYYGIQGAMYGLIWLPACSLLLLLPWYRYGLRMRWANLCPRWNAETSRKYFSFSLMLLTSAMTVQLAQVVARNMIEANGNWTGVGYWQATAKVSDAYLTFITVVLANYYLPRLSALKNRIDLAREVNLAYKIALPVLAVMSMSVFFFRDWLIILLFSKEFTPMRGFFTWQLIGDVFRVGAYIGAYVAVAKANTKLYILGEVYQAGMFISLCYIFVANYGAIGATYAYCLNYVLYFVIVQFVLRRYFSRARRSENA